MTASDPQHTLHNRAKIWLANTLGLDHSALHAHVGLLIWVVCVFAAGDAGAVWPLVVVFFAEGFNEILDRLRNGSWKIVDTVQDYVGSVFWPCILFAMARGGLL